jgi:poly(3-hydroxybutyrate) depolymerase
MTVHWSWPGSYPGHPRFSGIWIPSADAGTRRGMTNPRLRRSDAMLALPRNFNGCADAPEEQALKDLDPGDGSNVTIEQWTRCTSGAPVVLYRIDGGGHCIPHRNGR